MLRAVLLVLCFVSTTFAQDAKRPTKRPPRVAKPPVVMAPAMPYGTPPSIGDRGQLVGRRFIVLQVVDDKNAIITIDWHSHTPGPDGRDALQAHTETAWLKGDTAKLIDGRLVADTRIFRVTGKHKYTTNFGTKTVIVLEAEPEATK